MLRILGIVAAVAIAGVLLLAATRPDTFRVERSTAIAAPPERIFPLLDDFKAWPRWSPWEGRDPDMQRSYGATTRGNGAVYEWLGNKEVGQGRMRITDSAPPSRLTIDIDFLQPFEAHNKVEFLLVPQGASTRVSWSMQGPVPYLAKIMHLFMDVDRMVGQDFEAGLTNLKNAAEAPAAAARTERER